MLFSWAAQSLSHFQKEIINDNSNNDSLFIPWLYLEERFHQRFLNSSDVHFARQPRAETNLPHGADVEVHEIQQQQHVQDVGSQDGVSGEVETTLFRRQLLVAVAPEDHVGDATAANQRHVVHGHGIQDALPVVRRWAHQKNLRQHAEYIGVEAARPDGIEKGAVVQIGMDEARQNNATEHRRSRWKGVPWLIVCVPVQSGNAQARRAT